MPIHTAVRVSYPERGDYNWYDALATYQAIGAVEVAFYRSELFLTEVLDLQTMRDAARRKRD